jgi:hypothetical protein
MERTPLNPETLQNLLEIGRRLAENRFLDPLLEYAIKVALDLFGAEFGYLVLRQKDGTFDFRVRQDKDGNPLEVPEEQIS